MRKINHRKAQRRSMLYMVGISAAVLALSYLGKAERDRLEAIDAAAEEALRAAMVPDGYHPGASVEFGLSPSNTGGEALSSEGLASWFEGVWNQRLVSDCMISWWLVDPQITGEISMSVVYGSAGAETLRISQFNSVPPSASTCIIDVLNGLSWPSVDSGAEVQFSVVTEQEVVAPNMGSVIEVVESE